MMISISKNVLLASKSPRRKELLSALKIPFKVIEKDVDESLPDEISIEKTALYLAEKKAEAFHHDLRPEDLIITADTVVIYDNEILGKPVDALDARNMLRRLSGDRHEVITAVCLLTKEGKDPFEVTTIVEFDDLTDQYIDFYIENFKPFDKAGAYGIQEWIGMMGIREIHGDYFNVVGLPLFELFKRLSPYINDTSLSEETR